MIQHKLGIDGSKFIGLAVVKTPINEITHACTIKLGEDIKDKMDERRSLRRGRRSRLWHREPRFDNRVLRASMATGIYKRGKVWWIRYTGLDGKQKRESSHSEEHKAAVSLLADRQKTISEGKEPEIKRIPNYSFTELAEKYNAWIEGRQNSAKTKGYINRAARLGIWRYSVKTFQYSYGRSVADRSYQQRI